MTYNAVADSFHIKKLCSRLSSELRFYTEIGRFAFLSPFGGLGATYDDHFRLIGKRVVDFLLALIKLFR